MSKSILVVVMIVCVMVVANTASADIIRGIGMDFVTIGNPGNAADTGGTPGCGAVSYGYRIGKYEVTNAQWNTFTAAAGAPTGNPSNAYDESATYTGAQQPTGAVSWYETLQFCNYLTSGDKSKGAYLFSGNNTNPGDFLGINRTAAIATYGIIYFLPNLDEGYKAAFYRPDGSGYSKYTNGTSTVPVAGVNANYNGVIGHPWNVGSGTMEQNGTFDMMGNDWEWSESLLSEGRAVRGGCYYEGPFPSFIFNNRYQHPTDEYGAYGFRVAASVPEPATLLLFGLGGLALRRCSGHALRRKRRAK